jgi:hypothetical protein
MLKRDSYRVPRRAVWQQAVRPLGIQGLLLIMTNCKAGDKRFFSAAGLLTAYKFMKNKALRLNDYCYIRDSLKTEDLLIRLKSSCYC